MFSPSFLNSWYIHQGNWGSDPLLDGPDLWGGPTNCLFVPSTVGTHQHIHLSTRYPNNLSLENFLSSDQAPNSPPRYRKTSTPHWELKWVHHRAFTLNTLKYTHNTMTSYATGLYLFWVFAALEDEIIVSSVEHHLWCCSSTKTASLWLEMYARLKPRLQTRSERMVHCPLFLHIRAFLWPRRNSN